MALLGPFSVGYPVLFRSGGDTTRVAFGKHIQEIERIYGILNALDSDKISASDLDDKLAAFKPKLSFSDISGTLDISKITGNLDFSRITGNVPASRVVGKLSNANIDAGNVNGLNALVQSLIPAQDNKGDGITNVEPDDNGYAKFANGLIVQWGKTVIEKNSADVPHTVYPCSFAIPFPNACLNVVLGTEAVIDATNIDAANMIAQSKDVSRKGFGVILQQWGGDYQGWDSLKIHYSAIGY